MINRRQSGIKLTAKFDEMMVVPPKAWDQLKAAIASLGESYGLHVFVEDGGGQPEAYARWFKWWEEEMRKDIEQQEAAESRG